MTSALWLAGCTAAAATTNGSAPLPSDSVQPYTGAIGPDSPLYGFKITLENLDESFTSNQSEKLEKELNHTELRLEELKVALAANQTLAINRTLDQYWQKSNQSEGTLDLIESSGEIPNTTFPNGSSLQNPQNGTGQERALENLQLQQVTFRDLMEKYPNNTGLAQAYNNSLEREQRFEDKIRERAAHGNFSRENGKNVSEITGVVQQGHQDRELQNQTRNESANATFTEKTNQSVQPQDRHGQSQTPGYRGNDQSSSDDITGQVSPRETTEPADGQEKGNADGKNNDNGNSRQTGR